MLAFSATYTPELLEDLEPLMKRPQRIMLCSETVSLSGVRQFYVLVSDPQGPQGSGFSPAQGPAGGEQGPGPAAGAGGSGAAQSVFTAKVEALLSLLCRLSFHQVR